MAKVADEILVNIQVNKSQADAQVRQWQTQYNRSMDSVSAKTKQTADQIRASSNEIGGHLRTLAGTLAAGVTFAAIQKLADGYTILQNRLRVTGLEGESLLDVQERLFEISNRNGAAVGEMAQLYSRMALNIKDLGATEDQLLTVTSGVAAALRVQGISAEMAQGPLLQLGQAMGAGIVRAEEYNSIMEGMPVLVMAAAKGIDGAAGSTARLRQMMIDGKVSSREFFEGLLKGLPEVEAMAENATLTIGQAFTTLRNEMMLYIGQVDETLGASEKFIAAVNLLSGNLDKIAPAIAIIAAVLGGRFLAGMIGATGATIRQEAAFQRAGGKALLAAAEIDKLTASTARFATAGEIAAVQAAFAAGQMSRMQIAARTAGAVIGRAGSSILSVFGGPVGLAITGVTLALASLGSEAMDSSADIEALNASVKAADEMIDSYNPKAKQAANAAADVGSEALVAVPKINAFAGAVGAAAQQLWELARAKQAAALAELNTQREEVSRGVSDAQQRTRSGRRKAMWEEVNFSNDGARSIGESWDRGMRFFSGEIQDLWTGGEFSRTQDAAVETGMASLNRLDAAIARAAGNLEQFAVPDAPRTGGGGGATADRKTGGRGSAEAEARRLQREQERVAEELLTRQRRLEDDLSRAGDALLQAMMGRQLSAQERLDLDLQMLQRDRDANKRQIDRDIADGDKTEAEGQILKELEDAIYNEQVANRTREGQQDIRNEALAAEQALLDMQLELLSIQSGAARTAAESRRVQLEILRLQQERARAELEARIAADPSLNGDEMRARLTQIEKAQTAAVIRNTQDPLQQWFDQSLQTAEEVKEAYQKVAADGLDRITSSLVDVITGTKSAKEAFTEMALSIIADIIKMQARAAVANIIGALFPGMGGGNPMVAALKGSLGGLKGSMGTPFNPGMGMGSGMGPQAMAALGGKAIGAAGAAGALPSPAPMMVIQNFAIDAKGAILADALMTQMEQVGAAHAANAGVAAVSYQQARAARAANRNNKRFI